MGFKTEILKLGMLAGGLASPFVALHYQDVSGNRPMFKEQVVKYTEYDARFDPVENRNARAKQGGFWASSSACSEDYVPHIDTVEVKKRSGIARFLGAHDIATRIIPETDSSYKDRTYQMVLDSDGKPVVSYDNIRRNLKYCIDNGHFDDFIRRENLDSVFNEVHFHNHYAEQTAYKGLTVEKVYCNVGCQNPKIVGIRCAKDIEPLVEKLAIKAYSALKYVK